MTQGILLCAMCIGPETVNMAENLERCDWQRNFWGAASWVRTFAGAEGIVPLQRFHPVFDLARELGVPATCHANFRRAPTLWKTLALVRRERIWHGHHIYDEPSCGNRRLRAA